MAGMYTGAAPLRRFDNPNDQDNADTVPLTIVEPDGHARGGIIVLHETGRLTDPLLGLLRAVAGEGWIAVLPNLFHRMDREPQGQVFGDELFADFDACYHWLIGRGVVGDCIGVLGFDDAGSAAFLVATNRPVGAAISVAARGITEPIAPQAQALIAAAPQLQAPWLGLFGVDDPATPSEQIEQLADAVAAAPVATHVVRYSGLRHRADQAGVDDPADDELIDAQTRVFDWFDSFLR